MDDPVEDSAAEMVQQAGHILGKVWKRADRSDWERRLVLLMQEVAALGDQEYEERRLWRLATIAAISRAWLESEMEWEEKTASWG